MWISDDDDIYANIGNIGSAGENIQHYKKYITITA